MVRREKPRAFTKELNRVIRETGNPGIYQSGPPTKTTFNWVDYKEGSKVDNWRSKLRAGVDASSDFEAQQHTIDASKGYYNRNQWQDVSKQDIIQSREVSGHLFNMPAFGVESIDWSSADNLARQELFGKIKKAQTKMSGQVFLGELGEALRMMKSPAQALRRGFGEYFDALRRGKAKTQLRRDRMRFASETWLEYKFGWMSLVSDIEDAAEAVSQVLNRFQRKRVKGESNQEQASTVQTLVYPLETLEDECLSTTVTRTTAKVTWRCGLRSEAEGPDAMTLVNQNFGLTLRDFVPAAWELVPWSFAVDYFTNVGDILSAAFTDTSSVTWTNRTVLIETVRKNTTMIRPDAVRAACGPNFISVQGGPASYTATSKLVRRYALGLDAPSFRVTFPGLTSTKWLNLAALAHQHRSLLPFWK